MAKATATCTCATCGATFTRTTTKANRREADAWEAWAVKHYDECPTCWGKRQRAEEAEAGLIAKVRLGNPYDGKPALWMVLYGDTYSIKDQLKALGARWCDDYPSAEGGAGASLLYGMTTSRPSKRWAICLTDEEQLPAKATALSELGFDVQYPDADTMGMWHMVHAEVLRLKEAEDAEKEAKEAEAAEEKAKKLEELGPKPAYPAEISALWPDGAKWNGRIYGKKGHYRVYFSGEEVHITDKQKEMMEQTLAAREAWEEKKDEIERNAKA